MSGLTGEQAAPWLVFLSQHLPRVDEHGDICCSCGAPLYVGHLPRLLHDRADQIATARADAAVRAALEAAAVAIEAVFADPDRVRPLAPDAELATDLANDAQWAASIVRAHSP